MWFIYFKLHFFVQIFQFTLYHESIPGTKYDVLNIIHISHIVFIAERKQN